MIEHIQGMTVNEIRVFRIASLCTWLIGTSAAVAYDSYTLFLFSTLVTLPVIIGLTAELHRRRRA